MATHMPMAATRQPFAPLHASRLQNLTSLKNRQNALPTALTPSTKRKAASFDNDDAENIDPIIFLSPKRSKNLDGTPKDPSSYIKPTNFFLTKAPPSPSDLSSPLKTTPISPRKILQTRSAPKLNITAKSSPLTAPAGRSPTRKRIGILNRRRTTGGVPVTRIDPPKFNTAVNSGLGFSIDAALSGTIPSYASRHQSSLSSSAASAPSISLNEGLASIPQLHQPEAKDSWFFDIYEDTEEELAANLMEHSTCTLDISSDEESAMRMRDERGKENVPPADDISQTRTIPSSSSSSSSTMGIHDPSIADLKAQARAQRRKKEAGEIEIDRSPLGDLAAEDFYAEGCDGSSVFIIPVDASEPCDPEAEHPQPYSELEANEEVLEFSFQADIKGKGKELPTFSTFEHTDLDVDVDMLMRKIEGEVAPKAALLEPMEKAEEGFEVWESESAKGDK